MRRCVPVVVSVLLVACEPTTSVLIDPTDPGTTKPGTLPTTTTTTTETEPSWFPTLILPAPVEIIALEWELDPDQESQVYVSWEQDRAEMVHIEYEVDPGEWRSSPSSLAEEGANFRLLVGIPYEHSLEWRVVAETSTADGDTITTGDLRPNLPTGNVIVSDEADWIETGNFFLTSINQEAVGWSGGTYWTFIIDRQARVVWFQRTTDDHWTLYTQISVTGDHFLVDEATYWASGFDDGAGSQVHRMYLDAPIESIPTPGLHHAFIEMPDGTLTWGSQDHGNGEALVEKAPGQVDDTVVWRCPQEWFTWGQCESNSMYYDASRDTYLYSFYTNSTLVELDRTTGDNLWWAGEEPGGYDFDPPNSEFSWQHGITWTPQGTLLLSTEGGNPTTTWVREYIVDDVDQTLTEVWNFNSGVRADTNGDARRLANGNTLHVVGSASQIIEVDPYGTPVWRVEFQYDKLMGRGQFIEDLYDLVSPEPALP